MHWLKRGPFQAAIIVTGTVLFLILVTGTPVSLAHASGMMSGATTPSAAIVQATPTVDATVVALNKELLGHENNWWWNYGATILTSLISTFTLAAAGLFTVVRYFNDRKDIREKQEAEAKRLADDRKVELEKRAEERFQTAVEGLGSEREDAKVGAAITLRTFLHPGYEQFYTQTFDLAVTHLRLPRISHPPDDPDGISSQPDIPDTPLPLTTLSQALIIVFKEAFPQARDTIASNKEEVVRPPSTFDDKEIARYMGKAIQSLDATGVQLDNAYLALVDLKHVWMRNAFLRNADLRGADLSEALLSEANLSGADLRKANLSGAVLRNANLSGTRLSETILSNALLSEANLSGARLRKTNLSGARLREVNLRDAYLRGADLRNAYLHGADLTNTNLHKADLRGVIGLTKEQLAVCKAKGAIIDEDPTTSASQPTVEPSSPRQSNDVQASSAPSTQGSIPSSDPDGSNIASSQQEAKS